MTFGKPFEKGQGGRPKGARNRLSHKFLQDLLAEWEVGGAEALKIARIEDPVRFCSLVAGILPRELEINDNRLTDISDDELDKLITIARRQIIEAVARDIDGGKAETTNGGQTPVLLSVQKTS